MLDLLDDNDMSKLYNNSSKIMPWFYYLKRQNDLSLNLNGLIIYNVSTILFSLYIKSNKKYFHYLSLYHHSIRIYKLGDESEWPNCFKIFDI